MYRNEGPREMFEVTCADCGEETTVPFKPTGERPVYCRDCFGKHKPQRNDRGGGNRGNFSRGPREMHDATCSNCGKQTQVPFKPTPGRDVFCNDCFRR